jgi:hypothetical protein
MRSVRALAQYCFIRDRMLCGESFVEKCEMWQQMGAISWRRSWYRCSVGEVGLSSKLKRLVIGG